jgi:hypothetical protein
VAGESSWAAANIPADDTGRLFRTGKAAISAKLAGILDRDRLGSSAADGQDRTEKLRKGRWLGRFFAASRSQSSANGRAIKLNVRHLVDVA